jgi:hypothetical protein
MTETVYIEFKNARIIDGGASSKHRVYLSPVDTIDDTYKNELDAVADEERNDPTSIVTNTKRISHFLTINGLLVVNDEDATEDVPVTSLLPDPTSGEGMQDSTSKLGRMRALMGYGYDGSDDGQLVFYINGLSYDVYIARFTTVPTAGKVDFMDYILELIEGEPY